MIPFNLHRRIPLLRRPFYQRDQVMRERDAIRAERDLLLAERQEASRNYLMHWVRHRPIEETNGSAGLVTSVASETDDAALVRRIIATYKIASTTDLGDAGSFWLTEFVKIKQTSHQVLACGREATVTRLLRDPASSRLFVGFDELHDHSELPDHGISDVISTHQWIYDGLLRLAEAIGAQRLAYPERLGPGPPSPDVEDLLTSIDRVVGFKVTFPNPFAGEVGLATSRGVASFRAVQSLFQAWRISELVAGTSAARVVEVGAGLGRTAFYARKLGVSNYTIVDLPLTNAAQGYYLGRTMGTDIISLYGETPTAVRILPPKAFFDAADHYDLAVNIDSLTEMAPDTAQAYCRAFQTRADKFLSINHECNPFTVRGICRDLQLRPTTREAYWLRRGYVDEVYAMKRH